jgi:hypothetical protein
MANDHSSAPCQPDDSEALWTPHPAIPAHIHYVCQNTFSHFCKRPADNDEDNVLSLFIHEYIQKLEFFLQNSLLSWLEVTGNDIAVNNLRKDSLILQESSSEVQSFLTQVQILVEHFGFGFVHNPPHIYLSTLPFLPLLSLISIYHRTTYPCTLNVKYDQEPQKMMINIAAVVKGSLVTAISHPNSIVVVQDTVPDEYIFPVTVLNVYDI